VDTYTSGKDILELSNTISVRKSDLNHDISRFKEVLAELELLISGNERRLSFRGFRDYIKEQTNLTERLSGLAIIRTKFINLKQKKDQIESIQNKNMELDSEKNRKEGILKILPDYIKIIRS